MEAYASEVAAMRNMDNIYVGCKEYINEDWELNS
jgi:hypothetical protein